MEESSPSFSVSLLETWGQDSHKTLCASRPTGAPRLGDAHSQTVPGGESFADKGQKSGEQGESKGAPEKLWEHERLIQPRKTCTSGTQEVCGNQGRS